ncbi:MAG TPA: HlyD family secretion protein [Bryobacteraceae bacterium]|nr:HlyD family secretion protein [Bryobacteraceae bacterium]
MDTLVEELEMTAKAEGAGTENPGPAPKAEGKSKMWLLLGGLVIAAGSASAAYLHFRGEVSTDDAQVDAHIAPIAAKISGNISEILVTDNQEVKAGQPLIRIDARDYQAKVDQARADLAAAESEAKAADVDVPLTNATTASGTASAEAQLAAATADFERARADYDRASSSELAFAKADVDSKRATAERADADRQRMAPLAAQDEISKLQFDSYVAAARVAESDLAASQQKLAGAQQAAQSSKAAMDAAQARVAAAQAALAEARANRQRVDVSSAQAGTASAAVLRAQANLEAAELMLSYTTIAAPIDGVVTRKTAQLGEIVQPGQSLMTVVPVKDVWVTANFKETQLAGVRPGQRVDVSVDMYGRSFQGRVDSVADATGTRLSLLPPENATGNYVKIVQRIPVKIQLVDVPAGYAFRPGMNVDATIYTR